MRTNYSEDFTKVWKAWPGRYRGDGEKPTKAGKANAYHEWKELDEEDRSDILTVVCSDKVRRAGTQFLPDLERWLRARKWDDFL